MGFLRFSRARRRGATCGRNGLLGGSVPAPRGARPTQEGFRIPPPWALPVCTGEVVGAAALRRRTVSR